MRKKVIIISVIGVLIIGAIAYKIVKTNENKEEKTIKIKQTKDKENIRKNDFSKATNGLTDKELIKKYLLLKDSNVPVKDRVEASEVARKFAKAITEYNPNNPTAGEKDALSCVSDDIYKDVQGMFITKGKEKDSDLNKIVVTKFHSEESNMYHKYETEQEYIYVDVIVVYDKFDNHNQKHKDSEDYDIQLLKINGEYKVTSFRVI